LPQILRLINGALGLTSGLCRGKETARSHTDKRFDVLSLPWRQAAWERPVRLQTWSDRPSVLLCISGWSPHGLL